MTLLDPLAAFAGLAIVAIVALYFLKARRPYHVISSTLWWRPVTLDRQAAVPWQRLRPSWLLVLQVLAAALVLGALLRPAFATAQALTGQTIVVIDTSVTMQATDVAPRRFAKARADARGLVPRLGPQARMTLISMGANPVVLTSSNGDRQPLLAALAHLRPTDGQADLQDALQLAVAAAGPHRQGTHLVVLSDGVTEPLSEPVTLPFPVTYERIGESGENSGVTSVSIVRGLTGDQAAAHVQDFGREPAHLTVLMEADGRLTDAQTANLGPGGGQDVSFSVPPGTAYVKVSILPGGALGADDRAYGVVAPSRALRVLLVTPGDVFLQQALSLRADVKVTTETPAAYRGTTTQTGTSADLVVFDQYVPPTLPLATPFLLVAPPPDAKLSFGPPVAPGQLIPAEANDPLLYDVDLSNVDVAASTDLARSQFGRVVITSSAGPVLMVRSASPESPPAAVLGVYLHDSDLVLRSAFPLLIDHLSEYLAPDAVPTGSQIPGRPVTLAPGAGISRALVITPRGRSYALPAPAKGGTLVFTHTGTAGLYEVTFVARRGTSQTTYLAVNPVGGDISPAPSIEVAGTQGKALPGSYLYQEIWPLIVVLALVVLLIEWGFYHRAR